MFLFNSIQIVTLFAAAPILLQWLLWNPSRSLQLLGYLGCLIYGLLYIWITGMVWSDLTGQGRNF